jgi:hypothetical protein
MIEWKARGQDMPERHPGIGEYAYLSDCHGSALVSRGGSIDRACLPRFDSASSFARLLDRDRGGFCRIAPAGESTFGFFRLPAIAMAPPGLVGEMTIRHFLERRGLSPTWRSRRHQVREK